MKKMYALIITAVFVMSSFVAINMYNSASFPGYGSSETCNNCHNQPAFAKSVDTNFALGDWANSQAVFDNNGLWSTDEVPTIPANNRSADIEFVRTQFLTNSTDFMVMMEIEDTTPTNTLNASAVSDKFAIIFNIDSVNFTVGDFLNTYTADGNIDGQMGLKDGTADLWWIDTHTTGYNVTGTALDYYITSNYLTDGASSQDVQFALWYGLLAVHGPNKVYGYRLWFVRSLTTSDTAHDVQFKDGNTVRYAIAHWNDATGDSHYSSFDQMLVVGNDIGVVTQGTTTVNNNFTQTITESASVTSSLTAFSIVFVLAGLAMAIPIVSYFRPRNK